MKQVIVSDLEGNIKVITEEEYEENRNLYTRIEETHLDPDDKMIVAGLMKKKRGSK